MYKGFGVDHIGISVKNMETMRAFYQDVLAFTRVIGQLPEQDHPPLHQLARTSPFIMELINFNQESGGISIVLFHTTTPIPRAIRSDFRYGDIGLTKVTIVTADVGLLYNELKGRINFCSKPKHVVISGWGDYNFVYCKDPEGNLIEFISDVNMTAGNRFGGIRCVGISVTDLSRSISFYQKILGFDKVVIRSHERFSGLVDEVSGGSQTQVRSCVLANSNGGGMVELFEVMKPRGRSIPFGTTWGDFGYLQTCLYGYDIDPIEDYFEKEGLEFLLRSQKVENRISGIMAFLYIKDIDGIPVEFMSIPK